VLREKVTSKGGTTFAALEVLRQANWGSTLKQAVNAANERSSEMGQEFTNSMK
jgi:pyrroline-5-carboxylate reductase